MPAVADLADLGRLVVRVRRAAGDRILTR